MAKFQFTCPQCGQIVKADETWYGRDGECPYCGKEIVVPYNNAQAEASRKGGRGINILTSVKTTALATRGKVVPLWKSGTKGMVILCVPTLFVISSIVALMYFVSTDHKNAESQSQSGDCARKNGTVVQSSWSPPTSHQASASQAWDMDALRETYSKPMSADQEVYNNLLYLYLSMQGNYAKYGDIKKMVFEFDHTALAPDMKDFVSAFVTLLDKIGEKERRIGNCQDDRERERNDTSNASWFTGGAKAGETLSMFDPGGDEGFGALAYLAAGVIGGAIEANENDSRINEKYKRIVQEYREQENGLYIGFKQEFNKLRNSKTFKAFDRDRLLSEDTVALINKADWDTAMHITQCKVPELALAASFQLFSPDRLNEMKKLLIACIANYPQSLVGSGGKEVSGCYLSLAYVVLIENVANKFRYAKVDLDKMGNDLESMSPAEVATTAADSIAILDEAIKHNPGNHEAFGFRAGLRGGCDDYKRALADINTAIRISAQKSYFYDKACILVKGFNDAKGAKTAIREAFKMGFCDIKKLKADKDLAILQKDAEFLEMTKVKTRWWYKEGLMYSEIFLKNESCFKLTNVRLVSSDSNWRWALPESGTVTLEPGETFSKDWYDNPPSYVQATAEVTCDQNVQK